MLKMTRNGTLMNYILKENRISKKKIIKIILVFNPVECRLTGQVLSLLSKGHQFESHKPQSHLRLT
jgi:hypothetical protein